MKYILLALLLIGSVILGPKKAWAYFGFNITGSTEQSIEYTVDDVLRYSKVQEKMISHPVDFENFRKAILKAAMTDKEVEDSLRTMMNDTLPAIPPMPLENQDQEYRLVQVMLETTAKEYGYREELK